MLKGAEIGQVEPSRISNSIQYFFSRLGTHGQASARSLPSFFLNATDMFGVFEVFCHSGDGDGPLATYSVSYLFIMFKSHVSWIISVSSSGGLADLCKTRRGAKNSRCALGS